MHCQCAVSVSKCQVNNTVGAITAVKLCSNLAFGFNPLTLPGATNKLGRTSQVKRERRQTPRCGDSMYNVCTAGGLVVLILNNLVATILVKYSLHQQLELALWYVA